MANYKPDLTIEQALPIALQFVPKQVLEEAFVDPKKYIELMPKIFDLAESIFVDFNVHFSKEEE